LHVDGASLETVIVDAFFQALAPAELNLLEEVLRDQQADADRVAKLHEDQVARAEYEAGLAQRRYQVVDPANRLVAAELERSWEVALQAVVEAQEERERMVSQPQVASTHGRNERTLAGCWAGSSRTVGKRALDACPPEGHLAQPHPAHHRDTTNA